MLYQYKPKPTIKKPRTYCRCIGVDNKEYIIRADALESGARLGSLIDSFESEYDKFQNGDLKNLTKDQIVKIKFEYDLSQVEQKTQELIDQAAHSGSNNDLAGAIVSQKKERDLLEGRTKYTKDSDEGYSYSYDQIDKLQQKMAGATKTERAEINKQILAYQEMQNNFQKYRLDGGDLNWNDYLDTPSATAAFDEIIKKGLMTKDQLKDLFGEKATYEIDAKLNDDELQSKLKKLKSGESITFKADVDDIETDVEAVKNEDGTVTYTANVGGVPKEVNKIADADGKIHYTADFDGSKEWLENNLEKEETITFKADVAGVTQDIQAYKDEDGTIHYYSVLDNGTRKELEQHKNEDGTITYTTTADTSGVEKATKKAKENAEKNKIELEITAKDTNLVDKYIQEKQKSDAAKAKLSDEQAVHGNVDSRDRPMIYWDKENLKSNKSALKSWGQNPKDLKGSYSTVMGGSDEYQGIEIAYTPVLKTGDGKGEVISKNTMSKYINTLIDQAKSAGDGNWTTEDLLKLDSEGLLVDGKKISNMIADVGDTAKETGEKMHDIDDSLYSEDYAKYWDEISEKAEKANMSVEDYVNTVASIVEVNDSLKDMLDAKISYNSAYGVANDNQDNIGSINKSIKAQEDTINQLTKKLDAYQKEVNSQITSGTLKKGSEDYRSAQKNLNDFTANIYKASQELIELQDKLVQLRVDAIQTIIDTFQRRSDKLDKYSSLLEAKDETVPESVYQERLDNNNDTIRKNQEARAIWLKRQATEDVNSDNYKKYAEEIQKLDESTLDLLKDNEDLKNSIYSLRIKNLEDAIQGYDDLETELKGFRDLLNDDAFLDKKGGITDEGLAQITLLSQSIGNAKQKISDLTTGLQKVKELYDNGVISLKEYNDKSAEYRKELQSSTSDVKSYQKSLTDLYQNALKTEVDALQKVISKRKEATQAKEEYYSYDRKIREQSNDVNVLKSQIAALEGVNDAATLAKRKKLQEELRSSEQTLDDTKRDHRNELISEGFQKMSDDLNQMLEDTEYEISHNADKQNEIIQSMLNKQVGMYQEAYSKINSIIKNTGWVGSNDFNNNQSQMSSQTGAQNQASNASQSQQTANSKPSSSASGTDTSGIKDNASENNKITENIMKPENTTNRPVAELTVSKSSVSIEEGKSTSVTTKIRPNDAANKKLSWKSSNTAIATVSNGTISGKKPGSCQVTVSTTDGSGISKTIAVTVTKKPDPPKPAIPSNKGGDGVPRVGDVVTFNGKYYYDSWGKRPAGSLYSGVKNGVVIDSYSSRDYGGSARYTGDLKVHIKARDGRYGDLGGVRLSQISGYAKGTPGVDRDQIAIVDEEGRELQIPNGKGGRITKLEKGTGVIPHTATEKLMALSEQLDNNGNMVINGRTIEEYVNDMANMQSIAVPDFSDVTASVVSQLEGKGMGNVTVENHYDSLLTVEGNVDKDALPGLEDILKRSYEYTSKQMVKELRKGGMQIRR